jgi:hyperosmotically inducible periplasmic protein
LKLETGEYSVKNLNIVQVVGALAAIAFACHANAQASDAAAAPAAPATSSAPSSKAANRALAKKVRHALARTKGLDPTHIYVKVVGGAVTLSGSAATQAEIDLAVKAAQGVDGVESVKNGLTVRSPT